MNYKIRFKMGTTGSLNLKCAKVLAWISYLYHPVSYNKYASTFIRLGHLIFYHKNTDKNHLWQPIYLSKSEFASDLKNLAFWVLGCWLCWKHFWSSKMVAMQCFLRCTTCTVGQNSRFCSETPIGHFMQKPPFGVSEQNLFYCPTVLVVHHKNTA